MANTKRAIMFASAETGFALAVGGLWRSMDGGVSWCRQLDEPCSCAALLRGGFVVAGGDGGRIAISADSGSAWIERTLPVAADIVAVAASAPTNIVAATKHGSLFATGDGGRAWRRIDPPPGYDIIDVETTAPGDIWFFGKPSDVAIRTAAFDLWLGRAADDTLDAQAYWLAAERELARRSFIHTTDFGESWNAPGTPATGYCALKVAPDGATVLLIGGAGVLRANDGREFSAGPWAGPTTDAVDETTFACAGYAKDRHVIATTHDSGVSWRVEAIHDNGVRHLFCLDANYAWAIVASYGGDLVWGTSDGGMIWSRLTQPTHEMFGSIDIGGLSTPFRLAS